MSQEFSIEELEVAAATLSAAISPSEVFRTLLDCAGVGAPRIAIFLRRQGGWKGWGGRGYAAAAQERLRETVPAADSWLARAGSDGALRVHPCPAGETPPHFGQARAAESVLLPLVLAGRPVAAVLAERDAGEHPWSPAALSVLLALARARLDLDLVRRKLKATVPRTEPAAAAKAEPPAEALSEPPPGPAAAPDDDASRQTELVAVEAGEAPRASESQDDAAQEPVRRYARLIATDIRLYNEEAVMLGRRHGDLANRLGEHLNRGRETFLRRYGELGQDGLTILHDAFVKVLAGGNAQLLPPDP